MTHGAILSLIYELTEYPLELRLAAHLHMNGVTSADLRLKDYAVSPVQSFLNTRSHLRDIEQGLTDLSPGSRLMELAQQMQTSEANRETS